MDPSSMLARNHKPNLRNSPTCTRGICGEAAARCRFLPPRICMLPDNVGSHVKIIGVHRGNGKEMETVTLRFEVLNNHILAQNLYYNYIPNSLFIGYLAL